MLNAWRSMQDNLWGRSRVKSRPVQIHLEVNDFCNLECPMCPREIEGAVINTGNISMDVVRALGPLMEHAMHVGLVGNGEPFIHPRLFEIIEYVIERQAAPSIITNGTLMRQKQIDQLVKMGPMLLYFSFDGGTKQTYDKIRVNAKFEETVANIMALAEKKKEAGTPFPLLGMIVCLMNENVDELNEIVDIAAAAAMSSIIIQKLYLYNPMVRESVIRDPLYARRRVREARERAARHGIQITFHEMGDMVEERLKLDRQNNAAAPAANGNGNGARRNFYCEYAWQKMHVQMNGDTRVCCFWTQGHSGNVLREDPWEVWNSPVNREIRKQLMGGELPRDCRTCHMACPRRKAPAIRYGVNQLQDLWRQ